MRGSTRGNRRARKESGGELGAGSGLPRENWHMTKVTAPHRICRLEEGKPARRRSEPNTAYTNMYRTSLTRGAFA